MTEPVLTVTLNPALDKTVTVDGFAEGRVNRVSGVRLDAGGKGINVAKVLQQFGVDATAFGLLPAGDAFKLTDKLAELGLRAHFIQQPDGILRTNLKVVDSASGIMTEINEPGFRLAPDRLASMLAAYAEQAAAAKLVVLGGSLPQGAPQDCYRQMTELARAKQVPVILDADGPALRHGLSASPYAIKPNLHELSALCGYSLTGDEAILAEARRLTAQGIAWVLVSMGGDGSLLVGPGVAYRARPFPIVVESTVGAGDAMVAALAYGFLNRMSGEELARITSAAGSLTAARPGTSMCSRDEVFARMPEVDITRLA